MNFNKVGLRIAGTVFGLVAVIHFLRILTGISVLIGDWILPLWINWMGLAGTGCLCIWLWRMSVKVG